MLRENHKQIGLSNRHPRVRSSRAPISFPRKPIWPRGMLRFPQYLEAAQVPVLHTISKKNQRKKRNKRQGLESLKAMASLATLAAVQPAGVKGLAGSSITGTKLPVNPSRRSVRINSSRRGSVVAKYGEKSVYFDLEDLGNTTGQWDLYGSDAPSPYNPLQSKFFETVAAPFTKRGFLLKFLLLKGTLLVAYFGANASPDLLPIKKGPQLPPKLGPRGKI